MKRVKIFFALARSVIRSWRRYKKVAQDSATVLEFSQVVDTLVNRYFNSFVSVGKEYNFVAYLDETLRLTNCLFSQSGNLYEVCDSIESLYTLLGSRAVEIVHFVIPLVDSYIDFTRQNPGSSVSLVEYISGVVDLVDSNIIHYDYFQQMCDHLSRLFKIYRENNEPERDD